MTSAYAEREGGSDAVGGTQERGERRDEAKSVFYHIYRRGTPTPTSNSKRERPKCKEKEGEGAHEAKTEAPRRIVTERRG